MNAPTPSNAITLTPLGTFSTGIFDEGAAEIVAYDPGTQSLFAVNSNSASVDILDISDPNNPVANPMTEAQEVGEVPDGQATGDYIFTVGTDNVLTVTGTFSGLSSPLFQVGPEEDPEGNPQSAIHIHTGAAGENGPILRNLTVQTFDDERSGVFSGEFQLTAAEADLARNEGLYVNLHTENFNGGEIRGQFIQPSIDATNLGDGANSVDVFGGIVAVAVEAEVAQDPGLVAFYDTDGTFLASVEVGALPDMVTFTPDGSKVLAANEGEPSDDYTVDPVGSVSIIDLSEAGEDLAGLTQDAVATASFEPFNDQIEELRDRGARIFGPDATVAQDLEPEYIAIGGDSETAYVALQENNAFGVIDIETATVLDILPLGTKDHSVGLPTLSEFDLADALDGEVLGTTSEGEEIQLGGLSSLFFEGLDGDGLYQFVTNTDRGPDAGTASDQRAFKLPELQPEVVRFTFDPASGDIAITQRLGLTDANGNPLTGLPNLPGDDGGNTPVDLDGNVLPFDPLGADLEGIVVVPDSGDLWLVDEYRPSIYQFDSAGQLLDRYVPEGTDPDPSDDTSFGTETLPAVYSTARDNRGFEATALDTTNGILYAFIQTPLGNDGTGEFNREVSDASQVIRILGVDPADGTPVAEYVYVLERPEFSEGNIDKIGDAVFDPETGNFFVIERDSGTTPTSGKAIYEIDISGATNLLADGAPTVPEGTTLEQLTPDALIAAGIQPVNKVEVTNLPSLGYLPSDKPEGIAIVPDPDPAIATSALAVLNDNDFEPEVKDTSLGIISFSKSNTLDASDEDGINLQNHPLFGIFNPDAIASFTGLDGATYIVTANEGDAREYIFEDAEGNEIDAFIEEADLADLQEAGLLDLNDDGVPDAATDSPFAELNAADQLGEKNLTRVNGDFDNDGLIEQLHAFGGRSFSVFDEFGNLVFDSGDDFELVTREVLPEDFNANNDENGSFDNRSDNKGPEPEAVDVGFLNGIPYAFVGFERVGGIAVYDLSDASQPEFVQYLNNRTFRDAEGNPIPVEALDGVANPAVGDLGPEGLTFIGPGESPTGQALVATGNEVSGTTSLFAIAAPVPERSVFQIQGAGHTSPLLGVTLTATGIVTAIDSNGFYLQDPTGDGDIATSDAVFVFTGFDAPPGVSVGDEAEVTGTVSEFTPGGEDTRNLSTTQLSSSPADVTVLSSSNALPAPVIIGQGGRVPPSEVIDADAFTSFDPTEDGIDFFESLEGMRVTAQDTVAVSGTNRFGEIFTVVDRGAAATGISERGTSNISPDDFNPEKVQIDEDSGVFDFDFPEVNVGDSLGDVTGVVGYSFGNFEVIPTEDFTAAIAPGTLEPETSELAGSSDRLTVASYNVLNLDPKIEDDEDERDDDIGDGRFDAIAAHIVDNLNLPDIVALQEVQNNDGADITDVSSADVTLQTLIDAIDLADDGEANDSANYQFIDTPNAPADFLDENGEPVRPVGGQPGGTIRNAYLYNADRVGLVEDSVVGITDGDGDEFPFFGGRIPLQATFTFAGEEITLINNHFSSKGGSAPILGVVQPFDELQEDPDVNGSLDERRVQSEAVREIVSGLLAEDSSANVAVLGDLNEFEFVSPVTGLEAAGLNNLADTLPEDERYSFIFQGNSQSLDHILVSDNLNSTAAFEAVHVNTEFAETPSRASDHDPLLANLSLDGGFTLELLHVADQEAGAAAVQDAPRLSAVMNALEAQDLGNDGVSDNTLRLSSGDAIIPGLFFSASEAVFGAAGIADIQIQNELGFRAIALGNHEFDFGTEVLASLIDGSAGSTQPIEEAQEVAEVPDTDAEGEFAVTLLDGNELVIDGTFEELSAPLFDTSPDGTDTEGNAIDAIHIHNAPAGENGPIIRALTVTAAEDGLSGSFSGRFTLTEAEVAEYEAGNLYVNLHTENFNGGELRGQIIPPDNFASIEGLDGDFGGTDFPYLSTNLDFSTDENLAPLEVEGGQAPQPNAVTSSVVTEANGEAIGVVGATTPTLASISSPGGVGIAPTPFDATPTPEQLDALAAEIQTEVDALLAANPTLNKIVLLAHMQQISIEQELAARLENVDIIVAGGSNTRLFDENDRPRDGDSVQGEYPIFIENAGGTQTAVVNTDGSYKYVGRLVLDFDAEGNIIPDSYDPVVSGAYATDDQGVTDLEAEGLVDPEIQAIADAIEAQIIETEGNVFGVSEVFLNGNRSGTDDPDDPDGVRTQETNLGNLTADANLAIAQETDDAIVISLKNGGGIRASIGQTIVPPGGTEAERIPNEAVFDSDGNLVKPEGGISQNDIETTLAFNNGLTLLTLTKTEIVELLEHGVAALPDVSGRFPQLAGVQFSYDPDLEAGDRIQSAGIFDEEDNLVAELVRDGEIVGDASEQFRIVTLGFLADPRFDDSGNFVGGGDGYPFPNTNSDPEAGAVGDPDAIARVNRVDLVQEGTQTGDATFADDGSEQDALAEYLQDNFLETPFDREDTGRALDERIQNLNFREDTIFDEALGGDFELQILHTSDQEAGTAAFDDAPGLSAVLNALDGTFDNSLKLTSGDLFIAGPFFNASANIYENGVPGVADILIQNELGWNAAAVGNHEFDLSDEGFFEAIAPNAEIGNGEQGRGIGESGYAGAQFPYLATNLDYSEAALPDGLSVVEGGNPAAPNTLTSSVTVDVNGEPIGVLGTVTPYLASIASIGDVNLTTGDGITPSTAIEEQVAAIIANIDPEVQALTEAGVNKIVLMTHLQEAEIEQALAAALADQAMPVDVLIGGGSHRVMADEDTPLREDETQVPPELLSPYPQEFAGEGGTVYYVNTGANYRYLSQLVVTFDEDGVITEIGDESGTFATDIAGVDRLYDQEIATIDDVKAVADPELVAIVEGVEGFVNDLDGNIFGQTEVFLNGIRSDVRTQETNLGNLTADANDFYAEEFLASNEELLPDFEEIDVSFKNGGGIRDLIGQSFVAGGGGELVQLPPAANPSAGKEEGDISELDISNSLRFDNSLVVGKVTADGLVALFEHAVAATEPGATPGQFAQVGGIRYSFDPSAPAGDRLQSMAVFNEDGTLKDTIVRDGELVGDGDREFSIVTLAFLAQESGDTGAGGDGYPLVITEQQSLTDVAEPDSLGAAALPSGGEQDALAEYLAATFNEANGQEPFSEPDTAREEDERIQNLDFRDDTILDGDEPPAAAPLQPSFGTQGDDVLDSALGDFDGAASVVFAGAGNDLVDNTSSGGSRLYGGSGANELFAGTGDRLFGGNDADTIDSVAGGGGNRIYALGGDDLLLLGSGDRALGQGGADRFFFPNGGGDNTVTGGTEADQFWVANGILPDSASTITDFTAGEDVIGIAGVGVAAFADLSLGGDTDTTISALGSDLAILLGVAPDELSAENFAFADAAVAV